MGGGRPRTGCTLQLHGNMWAILYRDPRRGGKPVRRSCQTSDRQIAQRYKTHLDRILADKTLWNHPHEGCPSRVRNIWMGNRLDVAVTVDGRSVRVAPRPGQERKRQFEVLAVAEPPDELVLSLRPNTATFEDYTQEDKTTALADAYGHLETELHTSRKAMESANATIEALRNDLKESERHGTVVGLRLKQYEDRKLKQAQVGTLADELKAWIDKYMKRKVSIQRKRNVSSLINRFVEEIGSKRKADGIHEAEIDKYIHTFTRRDGSAIGEVRRKEIRSYVLDFLEYATRGNFDRKAVRTVAEKAIKRERKMIVWLERKEANRLIKNMYKLYGEYWGDLAQMQLAMGWRSEELTILQTKHASEKTVALEPVTDTITGQLYGKTGSRSVQVPEVCKAAIKRRLAVTGVLMFPRVIRRPSRQKREGLLADAWNPEHFYREYRKRLKKAAEKSEIEKPVGCRILRATFGSLLLRAGRTPYQVAKAMGDRVETVERHYARILAVEIDTNL